MAVMRVLLVDSNQELRRELWRLLAFHRTFRLESELETAEQAAEYILTHEVEVVFINHQPTDPQKTSTGDFLSVLLSQSKPHVQVVVYSDSQEWAYSAYRCQCAGYLLTPFDPLELHMLVNRLAYIFDLQQAKREAANRSIMIKTKSGYQFTPLQDILFIERSARKNRMVTTDGQEIALLGYTIGQLEEMLSGSGFYRCYQSFIVNLSKVSAVRADSGTKNYAIRFKDYEGEILLSREKYTEIVSLLKERYAGINI